MEQQKANSRLNTLILLIISRFKLQMFLQICFILICKREIMERNFQNWKKKECLNLFLNFLNNFFSNIDKYKSICYYKDTNSKSYVSAIFEVSVMYWRHY